MSKGRSGYANLEEEGQPLAHSGLAPAPPVESRKSKRSYRSVSPKEVLINFQDHQWAANPPGTAPNLKPSGGHRPNHRSLVEQARPVSGPAHIPHEQHHHNLTSYQRYDVHDDFLKPSPHRDSSPRPATASIRSTQFPSLSDRLKAHTTVLPPANGGLGPVSRDEFKPVPVRSKAPRAASIESLAPSLASTNFEEMSIKELLEYFLKANESTTAHASFVHVTPRFNVQEISRPNFYDLVVLERPGHPHSGYVWSREHAKYANNHHVLPKHMIMQLSLHGLLVASEEGGTELIPITTYLYEKQQFEAIRKRRFFGLFREFKVFKAWRRYTQHTCVSRMKAALLKDSYFSDTELIKALQDIASTAYDIEVETELFAFHGKGIVCVTDYFALQVAQVELVQKNLAMRVQLLGEALDRQYQAFMSSKKLKDLVQEVMDHHPLKNEMQDSETQGVEWARLRSIQRLGDNFKAKLKAILKMAQYRMEVKVAYLLERFWLRFKQFVLGIHTVKGNRRKTDLNYWDIDLNYFNFDGSLKACAFESNESLAKSVEQGAGPNGEVGADGDVMEPTEQTEQALCSKLLSTNAKVSREWEQQGSHLCVNVELYCDNRHADVADLLSLQNLDSLSVAITPTKTVLLSQMHILCGALGRLIESLPDLNKHPLIYVKDYQPHCGEADVDLGLGDLHNAHSSNYFTALVMRPIFNSRYAYQLAVDSIRLVHQAYNEASCIDSSVFRMFEIVRKLWSLAPTSLVKQIERSVAMPKIRAFIDQPDSVEDLKRSQLRDKGRLVTFRSAAAYLEKLPLQLQKFDNLKHRLGFMSCFVPLVDQIFTYRAVQDYYLHQRLPSSYATRCTIFYDFVRKLELTFDSQNRSTMELIDLMRKLKHFDCVKDYFDGEVEFCDAIFTIITAAELRSRQAAPSHKETMVASLLSTRVRHHVPVVSPDKLHRLFDETLERATISMSKLRSYLLTQLADLREAVLVSRQRLVTNVIALSTKVQECQFFIDDDGEAIKTQGSDEFEDITQFEGEVLKLRRLIDENVAAQQLLLEAHDIVGAANAILLGNQVDTFQPMEELESGYQTKCLAWKVHKDITSMAEQLTTSRLSTANMSELNIRYVAMLSSCSFLQDHLDDTDLLDTIHHRVDKLTPKIELVAFLSSKCVRPRHWTYLGYHVLRHCGMDLKLSGKQSEFVSLVDVTGREPVGLGNVNRLLARDLFARDVDKHLDKIKFIIAEAVIESFLENTLDTVEEALKIATVRSSGEWLKDSRLREKIYVELCEITNLVPLRVLSRYCWKAIMFVEATAQDMGLSSFDSRLSTSKENSLKMDKFLECYAEAQYLWMHVLHFVKFCARGEIDRDSVRSFNNCTEDMKKVEVILQQKSGNLYSAFLSSSEADMNAEGLRGSLQTIVDDVHSSVQSFMESAPRLTLLSYNRLIALMRAWLLGPHLSSSFVSGCIREMFEGVGELQFTMNSQKVFVCVGFISYNKLDKVTFLESIPVTHGVDEFVIKFEHSIRMVTEKFCDLLMVHRINCMKALLSDASPDVVIKNMQSLLELRCDHLEAMINGDVLNSAFLLVNSISYAEDLWTCLGHPTGSITMARPDLIIESIVFSNAWRDLLANFVSCCEGNIVKLQGYLAANKQYPRTSASKSRCILSGLILQETYFMQVGQDILNCDCVESAIELWVGHYQLRFQYAKQQRYNNCPLDVTLGNIAVPYGMEYQETGCAWLPCRELNHALSRVLSSAFSFRGTTLVHASESVHPLSTNSAEYSVSGKDMACALGRLCTTLTNASHLPNVRFFFSRMILLDAIGCVNFTTIQQAGLQNVIQTAQFFWSAIDNKNDQVIQDSLKFPLRARYSRNEVHGERRKLALKNFRNDIYVKQKLNMYISFILIGFATESEYSSLLVTDQFYRSIFDAVTVPQCCAYNQLGPLLASVGFMYAFDLQSSFVQALQVIFKRAETDREMDITALTSISSLKGIIQLIEDCRVSLVLYATKPKNSETLKEGAVNTVLRYREEVVCFCANLWERVLHLTGGTRININKLRQELFAPFVNKFEPIAQPEDMELWKQSTSNDMLKMRDPINFALIKSANAMGLICKHVFVQTCALFYDQLHVSTSSVVILNGEAACGKTAIWKTAVAAMDRLSSLDVRTESSALPVTCRLAGKKILFILRKNQLRNKSNRRDDHTPILDVPKGVNHDAPRSPADDSVVPKPLKDISNNSNVMVIFHASLTASALLGGYDLQGRWMDGILTRKIRFVNEQAQISEQSKRSSRHDALEAKPPRRFFIVLNGPVSLLLEELLYGMFYQIPRSISPMFDLGNAANRLLLLPTNENVHIADNVRFIIETHDLSNASPSCLNLIPTVNVSFGAHEGIVRILTVWIRSISQWLGDFPPWLDLLEELNALLLNTKFVEDLLYDDLTNSDRPCIALINSHLGSFLRILEELLLQCHELALEHSVFVVSTEKESVSDSEDEGAPRYARSRPLSRDPTFSAIRSSSASIHGFKYVGAMSLNPRAREQLILRARLSIIYAAIWGFGGSFNSTDKRKFFDTMLRDSVQNYMDSNLVVCNDCLVFELVLDLERCDLLHAVQFSNTHKEVASRGLTQKQLEQHVYCDLISGVSMLDGSCKDRLVFRSTSTRAVTAILQLLITSGANVLAFGSKGCGKTRLIVETLDFLKQSNPSPADLRKQIISNLLNIVCDATKPQGIFRALEIVRTILLKAAQMQHARNGDDNAALDFNELWRGLNSDLEVYMSGSSRQNCKARAVSSAVTSLSGHAGARGLRGWFEREFATEVPHILETARFGYGVAFIDDVHCLSDGCADGSSTQLNLADELLRGLLDGHPIFGITRTASVRNPVSLGYHLGSDDGAFTACADSAPILHKEGFTDIRMQLHTSDDFMMQHLGIVTAATGQYTDLCRQPWLKALAANFALVSLPAFQTSELNVALITGAITSMSTVMKDFHLLELLQSEVADLSRITLNVCMRMVSSADLLLTTSLERTVRSMISLDTSLVSKFCLSLRYGSEHVKNPGGLLQLYVHEWKRYLLDPLPQGAQRDRVITLLTEYMDNLDEKTWSISHDWMKDLKDELLANVDRVWTNANVFKSALRLDITGEDYHIEAANEKYLPMSLDVSSTDRYLRSGAWNPTTKLFDEEQTMAAIIGTDNESHTTQRSITVEDGISDIDVKCVMYPAALTLLLRMVRILSVAGKHMIIAGYPGSSKMTAVLLAAKICHLQSRHYVAKESQSATDTCCERAAQAFDFKLFIKRAVLRVAGFSNPIVAEDFENGADMFATSHGVLLPGQVYYDALPSEKVVIVVDEAQQLNTEARKWMLHLLDYSDPSGLFDDSELQGMVDALRRSSKLQRDHDMLMPDSPIEQVKSPTSKTPMKSALLAATDLPGGESPNIVEHHGDEDDHTTAPQKSTVTTKAKNILTGYMFHWIKSHLCSSVNHHLHIVLGVALSRCSEINPASFYSHSDSLALLRKVSGLSQPKKSSKANDKSSVGKRNTSVTSTAAAGGDRRFSVRSNRSSAQSSGGHSIYNPTSGSQFSGKADTQADDPTDMQSSGGVSNSNLSIATAQGIFTCPVLGPLLSRRFAMIWYDIDSNDAINGVCTVMLKNSRHAAVAPPKTSVVLSLRSSIVGTYNQPTPIASAPPTAVSVPVSSRRMSVAEKQAVDKAEQRRMKFIFSSNPLSKYHLCFQAYSTALFREDNIYAMLHLFGVFSSFDYHFSSDATDSVADQYLPYFLEEAKSVLPHVLTLPLPSDAQFLKEPVYTIGAECIARRAASCVLYILQQHGKGLLKSKHVLEQVLIGLQDASVILEHDSDMDDRLLKNNDELTAVIRSIAREADDTRNSLETVHVCFQHSLDYEMEQFLLEDLLSAKMRSETFAFQADELRQRLKAKVSDFTSHDWQVFSGMFSSKPVQKSCIEVMRAVMVVINFTPPKIMKGEKNSSHAKMDDDVVAKCTMTLLLKSHDFANQLRAIQPSLLSQTQINALRIMNSLLNSHFVSYFNTEFYSPERRLELQEKLVGHDANANPVFDCLRRYLLAIDLQIVAEMHVKQGQPVLEAMQIELNLIQKANLDQQEVKADEYKCILNKLQAQMSRIEATIMSNRKKLDIMERNRSRKPILTKCLSQMREHIEEEHNKINSVVRSLVGDVCVAVAIFFRCGWLPESVRQDCMDTLRRNLRFHKILVSESPFILGCLCDRLQQREFCSFNELSMSNDIPTINAISLLYLSPRHTLIVDPDGVAVQAVIDTAPAGYEVYSLPAQKLSLPVFETWVASAFSNSSTMSAIYLVLYDVQAGISDDLICLLTSKLDYDHVIEDANNPDATLEQSLPRLVMNTAVSPDVTNTAFTASSSPFIYIPSKFRIVLVSTKVPLFNTAGDSFPLPVACMENVNILHWTSTVCPFVVETKPFEAACEKQYVSSNLLSYKLTQKILPVVTNASAVSTNSVAFKLAAFNKQIVEQSKALIQLEIGAMHVVFEWLENDRADGTKSFNVEGLVEQKNISLSLLSSEPVIEALTTVIPIREQLQQQIMFSRLHFREALAYFETLMDVFTMTSDYVRMCGICLPVYDLFSPYSLSPVAMALNFLHQAMSSVIDGKLIGNVPNSIYSALRVWNGIASFQRLFRQIQRDSNSQSSIPSPSGRSSPKKLNAGFFDRRDSLRVMHIVEQSKKSTEEHGRDSGLAPSRRSKGAAVLSFMLCPLRARFAREIVRYAELNIRPGYEYLVKYLLLLTIWAQSNDVATEEIRALFHLLLDSQGVQDLRYVHLLPLKRSMDTMVGLNRMSAQYLSQSNDQWFQRMQRGSASTSKPLQGRLASVGQRNNSSVAAEKVTGDSKEVEDVFREDLPNASNIRSRVTAYRMFQGQHTDQAHDSVAASFGQGHLMYNPVVPALWRSQQLLERGDGVLDGLYFNTRSVSWQVQTMAAAVGSIATRNAVNQVLDYDSVYDGTGKMGCRGKFIMADHYVELQLRNRLVRAPVYFGDPFEVEWLKSRGIRAFHTMNAVALSALGATTRSIDEINRSRRHTVTPGKAAAGKQAIMKNTKRLSTVGQHIAAGVAKSRANSTHRKSVLVSNVNSFNAGVPADRRGSVMKQGTGEKQSNASAALLRMSARRMSSRTPSLLEDIVSSNMENESDRAKQPRIILSRRASMRKSSVLSVSERRASVKNNGRKSSSFSPAPPSAEKSSSTFHGSAFGPGEDITEVVQNKQAFQNLLILENHPLLSPVFKGISGYIGRNAADFLDWRDNIQHLSKVECKKISKEEILDALENVKPPICLDFDPDNEVSDGNEDGLYMRGYELSVIQSVLLSEAMWPGCAVTMLDFLYVLIRDYLKKGGHAMVHADELFVDDDDAFEDDEEDRIEEESSAEQDDDSTKLSKGGDEEDDDEEEADNFDMSGNLPRPAGNGKLSVTIATADPLRKASASSFFKSLNAYESALEQGVVLQDNVTTINCWTKLERVVSNTSIKVLAGPEITNFFSRSTRTLRDYNNWESILLQVVGDYQEIDKFVYMQELRDTIAGAKSTYFLAPFNKISELPQMSIFSQRARDYAMLTNKHVPIVFCDLNHSDGNALSIEAESSGNVYNSLGSDATAVRAGRAQLAEVVKSTKMSIAAANSKKAILERLDLSSTAGTAIIYSVLLPSITYRAQDQAQIVSAKSAADEGKSWRDSFPLIITSSWGNVSYSSNSEIGVEEERKPKPSSSITTVSSHGWQPGTFAPPMALAELAFAWLPRYFAADVVKLAGADGSASPSAGGDKSGMAVTLPESCGVLYEELEAGLLWVINSTKLVKKTRITEELRKRMNQVSKLQTRMIATLLTVYQLQLYLRAEAFEARGLHGVWSSCLNQLDLWQLSRLVVKLSDLLSVKWTVGQNAAYSRLDLLQHAPFRKAVEVLAESFSKLGMDMYNAQARTDSGSGGGGKRKLLSMISSAASSKTSAASLLSKMNGMKTLVMQLKPNLANVTDPKGEMNKSKLARAQKQWKKAARKIEENRLQYVHHLSNTLIMRSLYRSSAPYQPLVVDGNEQQFVADINARTQQRFFTMIEHYIAEIVAIKNQSVIAMQHELEDTQSATVIGKDRRVSSGFETATQHIVNARKHSTKMNIRSVIADGLAAKMNEVVAKAAPLEMAIGALAPDDTLQCLVKWTLDGSGQLAENGRPRIGGVDRMRVLRSIKRLSMHVQQKG